MKYLIAAVWDEHPEIMLLHPPPPGCRPCLIGHFVMRKVALAVPIVGIDGHIGQVKGSATQFAHVRAFELSPSPLKTIIAVTSALADEHFFSPEADEFMSVLKKTGLL